MRLILDVDTVDGSQQRVWMSVNELLRIGRSSSADVCVPADAKLADIHFMIEGAADGWSLQAAPGARVGVNGLTSQVCLLRHGDRIVAGETEFHVTIEGEARTMPSGRPPEQSVEPLRKVKATWVETPCSSGVIKLTIKLNDTTLAELLSKIRGDSAVWSAVNEQQLGGSIRGLAKQTEDLFAQAPAEIRETDSLFLGSFELEDQVLVDLQSAARADGAVVLVSPQPLKELLEQQRMIWAWFSRPSILTHQLDLGSQQLAKKLMGALDAIVLLCTEDADDVVVFAGAQARDALLTRLASL